MSRNASTGAYTFPASTVRPAVDGTVISSTDFNAALADLETAVSYAYGSATPTITFGGASTGITYGTQKYEYTVIGNRVFFLLHIVLTSKGSSTGTALVVVTHPQAPASTEKFTSHTELINVDQASGYLNVYLAVTSAGFSIRSDGDNVSTAALTDAAFSNTSGFTINGHFRF